MEYKTIVNPITFFSSLQIGTHPTSFSCINWAILSNVVSEVACTTFLPLNNILPFTVGGGIRSIEDFRRILREGADKVAVNSAAIMCPKLISDAAEKFGSQCVVVAIDAKKRTDKTGWNIYNLNTANTSSYRKGKKKFICNSSYHICLNFSCIKRSGNI